MKSRTKTARGTTKAKATATKKEPAAFTPIADFSIPAKVQRGLYNLAVKNGERFNKRYVVNHLASIAGV